jgi:phage tail protein X
MTASAFIEYRTRAGDTFDELALQVYNSERMAHHIIEQNPDYADVIVFEEPVLLKIPVFDSAELPETLAPWRRGA